MKQITYKVLFVLFVAFPFLVHGQRTPRFTEYVKTGNQTYKLDNKQHDNNKQAIRSSLSLTFFDSREDYLANCLDGSLLTSEDFSNGPGSIGNCGDVLSSLGDTCFPEGELEEGFEIAASTPGNGTIFLEAGFNGTGTINDTVGTDIFIDFTSISFTGSQNVTSVAFDVYSLPLNATFEIRIFGSEGLIDAINMEVLATGPTFVGIISEMPLVRVEIEDISGANIEHIALLQFGNCALPTCEYTLELNDSFGDGWNGALLNVLSNGSVILNDITLEDGSQSLVTIPVEEGADITTEFTNTGDFPDEISYRILNNENTEVGFGSPGIDITTGTLIADCIFCFSPTGLIVEEITDISALLSWNDNTDPFSEFFTIEFGLAGFEQGTGTVITNIPESSFLLGGLTGNTTYDFYVQANCGPDENSSFVGPMNFTTAIPSGMCGYTLEMNDSFGDGWNGGTLDVLVDGTVVLDNVTLEDDINNTGLQGNIVFPVSSLSDVTTEFVDNGSFPDEISYRVLDTEGNEVGFGSPGIDILSGTIAALCIDNCNPPTDLNIESLFATNASISWTNTNNGESSTYTLEYGLSGFELGVGNQVFGITETMGSITNLIPETNYDVYVRANCNDGSFSSFTGPINFTTPQLVSCDYTLEMNDLFGDGWNGAELDILIDGEVVLDNATLENGFQGFLTFPVFENGDVTTTLVAPGDFPIEVSYRILNTVGIEVGFGNFNLDIPSGTITAECSECTQPIDLSVDNITQNSAFLNWVDINDTAPESYDLEWGEEGFILGTGTVETGITATEFLLESLLSDTSYDFYVTANCSIDSISDVSGPFTFITDEVMAPPGECEYTLEMSDGFGDGWNGATMDVLRNGVLVLNDVTLNDGAIGTLNFEVLPGDDVTTVFGEPGAFPDEISYTILDTDGAIVGSGDATDNITSGTITAQCISCDPPFNLAVSDFSIDNIDISWDIVENAISYNWEIQNIGTPQGDPNAIATGSTSEITENVNASFIEGESYTLYVQSDCGNNVLSAFSSIDFVFSILSVDDILFRNFTFFPNPMQDVLNIDSQIEVQNVTIVSLLGQTLSKHTLNITHSRIDVSNLSSGTYFMLVSIDGKTNTYQLIKE